MTHTASFTSATALSLLIAALSYAGGLAPGLIFLAWASAAAAAALLWSGSGAALRKHTPWHWLDLAIAFYAVAILYSVRQAPMPDMALELAGATGLLCATYTLSRLAWRAGCGWQHGWELYRLIVVAMAAWAFTERLMTGQRAYAAMSDPNLLAGIFNATILVSFAQAARHGSSPSGKRQLTWPLTSALIAAAGLGATGSLSGLLCLVLILPLLTVIVILQASPRQRLRWVFLPVVLVALAITLSRGTDDAPTQKIQSLQQHSSFTVRKEMVAASLAIYRQHGWGGSGLGTYKLYYPQHRGPLDTGSSGDLAHNDYVQFLQEGGPPLFLGLIVLLLFSLTRFACLLWAAFKRQLSTREWQMAGASAGALVLFAHAGMNFIFYSAFASCGVGLLMAALAQPANQDASTDLEISNAPNSAARLFFCMALAAFLLLLTATFGARAFFLGLANETCNKQICKQLRADPAFMRDMVAYLLGTQPTWIPARDYLLSKYSSMEANAVENSERDKWQRLAFAEAVELIRKVPEAPDTYVFIASLVGRNSALLSLLPPDLPTDGVSLYRKALEQFPQHLPFRLAVAELLRQEHREQEAFTLLFTEGMRYWHMRTWGDAGRMRVLTQTIPLAVTLGRCSDAHEMAEGLKVFQSIADTARREGARLPDAAVPAPLPMEVRAALDAAHSCKPSPPLPP